MRVIVVILSYNGSKWIRRCLSSLQAATAPSPAVLVVDNHSSDDTAQIIRAEFPQVTLIEAERNLGFAAGVNLGIQHALKQGGDFVFLLNQDTHIHPDCVRHLTAIAQEAGPMGIFSCMELNYEGSAIDECTRAKITEHLPELVNDLWFQRPKTSYLISVAYGNAILIHRRVFERIGLFDELFFMYVEDMDFSYRASRAGIPIWLVPEAIVYHQSTSSKERGHRDSFSANLNRRGWLALNLKDPACPLWRGTVRAIRHLGYRCLLNVVFLRWMSVRHCLGDMWWLTQRLASIRASRQREAELSKSAMGVNRALAIKAAGDEA